MKNVIIIEDDQGILDSLMDLLSHLDMQTHGADSGEDGLRLIKLAPRPAVVLLDICMPGMNGIQVLEEILKIKDSGLDVILMTADNPQKYAKLMEAGCTVIGKPFDLERMEDAIESKLAKLA